MAFNNIVPMDIEDEDHEVNQNQIVNQNIFGDVNQEVDVVQGDGNQEVVNQPNFDPIEYQRLVNTSRINRTEEQFEQYFYENINHFFEIWKNNISNLVFQSVGIHLLDLPDFHYRSSFEESVSVESMTQHILGNIP